jgi:hypothetical protein
MLLNLWKMSLYFLTPWIFDRDCGYALNSRALLLHVLWHASRRILLINRILINLYDASPEIYFLHPYVGEVDKLRTTFWVEQFHLRDLGWRTIVNRRLLWSLFGILSDHKIDVRCIN